MLKYLARYMTGGPISDRRIIRDENDRVTFWARSKDKAAGNPSRPFPLPGKEFVRRWSMHILAQGLHPLAPVRWLPRQQTQGLSTSLPRAADDRQSPTDFATRTH